MDLTYDASTMGTGFPGIDAQHEELLRCLDLLLRGMGEGRGRAELAPLVDFLVEYARSHLSHEERCMARLGCPHREETRHRNGRFVTALVEFRRDFRRDGPSARLELRARCELGGWMREHVLHAGARPGTRAPVGAAG